MNFSGIDAIYIAGPMTGYPDHNFPAFDSAERRLCKQGLNVISPAEIDRVVFGWGTFPPKDTNIPMFSTKKDTIIRRDIAIIFDMDAEHSALYMLDGWFDSPGACLERAVARYRGMKIFYEAEDSDALSD